MRNIDNDDTIMVHSVLAVQHTAYGVYATLCKPKKSLFYRLLEHAADALQLRFPESFVKRSCISSSFSDRLLMY